MRVLIVEDHDDTREGYSVYLKHHGFTVFEARNGREAIACASKVPLDVILMDLSLPRLDGWEATRRLKRYRRTRDIPVVATSGHAYESHKKRATMVGCAHYLVKPFRFGDLLTTLKSVTRARPKKAPTGRAPKVRPKKR
jgi:DNA-binding response OmpR family regulator